jgi:predicted MFS family arabinose efflux permease
LAIATIASSLVTPLIGWAIDSIGARRSIMIGAVAMPAAMALLSWLPPYYGAYIALCVVVGTASSWLSAVTVMAVPPRWFDRSLGMALALAGAGFGAGQACFSSLTGFLVGQYGWRISMIMIAGIAFVIVWLALVFLLRDSPVTHSPEARLRAGEGISAPPPLRRAVLSLPFLLLATTFMLVACVYSGLTTHLVPMLSDRGMAPEKASIFLAIIGASSVAGRLGAGYFLDRVSFQRVAAPLFLGLGVAILILMSGTIRPEALVVAAMLVGFGIGGEADLLPYVIRRVFHPAQFGRIYGLAATMFMIGAIVGALAMAHAFDYLGGYKPALIFLFVIANVSAGTIWLASVAVKKAGIWDVENRGNRRG